MNDLPCMDFECKTLGKCINEDMLCKAVQKCPRIRAAGKCAMCLLGNVCPGSDVKKRRRFQDAGNC